jgi:predicted dehydrogenase
MQMMAEPEQRPVRIGLVGAGAIMRLSHGPTVSKSPDARLSGVFDPDGARAEALAGEFGAALHTTKLETLLASDIDAVIVASPNNLHEAAVVAAAAAGKHIFCEKPLSLDVAGARRMIDACETAGVLLQVGFNQRFWSQVQIAKAVIDAGVIGPIHAAHSNYGEKWTAYPAATTYRYDLARSGGATIIDLTIHRIDLLRHLVGEMTAVFADLSHHVLPQRVDDNVHVLTRFASGARGVLTSNRYSPAIADGTTLYGERGTIHIATETLNPFQAVPLAIYTESKASDLPEVLREAHYPDAWWKEFDGGWISVKPPRRSPYLAQLAAFCSSIRNGLPALVTGFDGLKAQEVVQASYLSVRDGCWVELPLPRDAAFVVPSY